MVWNFQEAKANFSEVIDRSIAEGPQTISRSGVEVAVIVSIEDYRELLSGSEESSVKEGV